MDEHVTDLCARCGKPCPREHGTGDPGGDPDLPVIDTLPDGWVEDDYGSPVCPDCATGRESADWRADEARVLHVIVGMHREHYVANRAPATLPPRRPVARPRERRERRHVARATSSADGGDSDSDPPPQRSPRDEVLAGERCALCDTRGQLIAVARVPWATVVACFACGCENTIHHHGGER